MFSKGYLLPTLLSCLCFLEDLLEHLNTRCRWMTHDMVFCPVMEVVGKGLDGTVVRSIIPALNE